MGNRDSVGARESTIVQPMETEVAPQFNSFNIELFLLRAFSCCCSTMYEVVWANPALLYSRIQVLLWRSSLVFVKRGKLVIGAIIVHILLAVNFYFILRDASQEIGSVLSFYGIGCMLLIISNIQFAFFVYKSNEVRKSANNS